LIEPQAAAAALADIAEASIRALTPRIVAEIGERHGRTADAGLVVLDMGDLGAREMTWASRPSAILIRENPPGGDTGNSIPSPTSQPYHVDLASHLIDALSLPAIDGNSDEADMHQVFSEDFGAVCWSVGEFRDHFASSSGTAELLALSRARVVAGPPALAEIVRREIRVLLTQPKDPDVLLSSIDDRRTRPVAMNREEEFWATSSLRREIRNLDLAVRYLQLRYIEDHPELLEPNTHRVLVRLRDAGLLGPDVANDLIAALNLWQAILGMLGIAFDRNTSFDTTDPVLDALKPRLAQIADVPDFTSGTELLRETSERVDAHIRDVMGRP
jgi:glutamate-ammonia-ligase adenylyltransferase